MHFRTSREGWGYGGAFLLSKIFRQILDTRYQQTKGILFEVIKSLQQGVIMPLS
jgi:hypothetical protein